MTANLTETLALVAAIAALGAFWVSWREARRNNRVIVKLKEVRSCFSGSDADHFYKLEILVVNRGVQMQDVSMGLDFHGPGKSGSLHLPIPLSNYSRGAASTFLRGTMAKFVLSTADRDAWGFLRSLRDFKEQRPEINLYNCGFLACSFSIYSRWDWIRRLWNKFSFQLRFEHRVGEGREGKGVFRTYQLPYFNIRSEKLQFFLQGVEKAGGDTVPS